MPDWLGMLRRPVQTHRRSTGGFWCMHFLPPPILIHITMPGCGQVFDEIQIQISCDIPCVTCTLFSCISSQPVCSTSVLYSTTWHLLLFKAYALYKLCKELLQMLVSCFISHFMSLSTTGLILLSLISTFLQHLMKRRVIGSFCRQPR